MRGVAAEKSAERACERSSDWRRGARRAPPTRTSDHQPMHASFATSASAFRFTCHENELVVRRSSGNRLQGNLVAQPLQTANESALDDRAVALVEVVGT